MLELRKITKIYATDDFKQTALDNVSITFKKNEFVSILGPSGSGKTTLLNIIGGLDEYTDGDLIINNVSTKKYKDTDWDSYRNHSIGFVFQSYNLIPHQSILQNVELALTLSGVNKQERRKRAKEALEKVGLTDHMNKRPNQMSGGQMQRVAIARALVNNPDIVLADEPTGALDSKTSEQIMELLKEVAKDRLVIMVTHNAEIAEKYSTRIVELKDGQIINDTDPVTEEERKVKQNSKTKRISMSMMTALSLSLNNLLTKKGRTILTAFAGSIGIIGIALILSLSHGIQSYIDKTEQETLSSYPLVIQRETVDMNQMIESMTKSAQEDSEEQKDDELKSITIIEDMFTSLSQEVKRNDMKDFKNYIESDKVNMKEHVTSIQYGYGLTPNIYKVDDDKVTQVNPNTIFDSFGMSTAGYSQAYSGYMSQYDVFTELIDNEKLLKQQYDLVKGRWPKEANEMIIVLGKHNEITDYSLYSLGLLDQEKLKKQFSNMTTGKEVEFEKKKFKLDDLLGLKYKIVLKSEYYEKVNGIWVDNSTNEAKMNNILNNAEEIEIVGIIRPNPEAVANQMQAGTVGYTHEFIERIIERTNNSEIVKEQLANKEVNIFTNTKFEDAKKFDMSNLTMDQKIAMSQMSQDELAAMIETYTKNATASYEENIKKLGVADLDNPETISIFPKDFDAKEEITAIIDKYNEKKDEAEKLEYTDIVGIMMSSVSSIVNVISSVLIAFVAISLVVSSIMIAIITYISVIERTKEIGILRAIGASKKDISRVFNAETLIEGLTAGVLGILVTIIINIPANIIIKELTGISNLSKLPTAGAIILIIISVLLTVIAGFIPAKIASKKDPVEALRTE
ncbi:MAG: ABC transporter ATP-binding protein/permease [Bacilli bacterium]|nr:ABC transporter ATP-binding protein/permease [Bacilli bacterium]